MTARYFESTARLKRNDRRFPNPLHAHQIFQFFKRHASRMLCQPVLAKSHDLLRALLTDQRQSRPGRPIRRIRINPRSQLPSARSVYRRRIINARPISRGAIQKHPSQQQNHDTQHIALPASPNPSPSLVWFLFRYRHRISPLMLHKLPSRRPRRRPSASLAMKLLAQLIQPLKNHLRLKHVIQQPATRQRLPHVR
jgi:hypothetical protein